MDDYVRTKAGDRSGEARGVRHVYLLQSHIGQSGEERAVRRSHEDVQVGLGMFATEVLHQVVAERAGGAGDENALQVRWRQESFRRDFSP